MQGWFNIRKLTYYTTKKEWRIKTAWSSQQRQKKQFTNINAFMIKTIEKLKIKVSCLHIIKPIFKNSTVNIIFNSEKLKMFPLRSETRQRCPLLSLLFNKVLKVLARKKWTNEINKRHPNQNGRRKVISVFRWHDLTWGKF